MITGPKYKIARRLGPGVFEKTQTQKFALKEQNKGRAHGTKRGATRTDYGKQLIEKQKVRVTYGILERQFRNMVDKAIAKKSINSAEALYITLESRLDNIVYRAGFAPTRQAARQLVSHGHIRINGKKVTIPSYQVVTGEKISIRENSLSKPLFATLDERLKGREVPSWLKLDTEKKTVEVQGIPKMVPSELPFDLLVVIEFYSR